MPISFLYDHIVVGTSSLIRGTEGIYGFIVRFSSHGEFIPEPVGEILTVEEIRQILGN